MKNIRIALSMMLILGGMGFGIYVTLFYFAEGISLIRYGQLQRGLIVLLVWSELLGILATLSLVVPGVLLLRTWERNGSETSPSGLNVLLSA